MTLYRLDPLSDVPYGQPVEVHAIAWGMTYPGEIVRAERWDPRWGQALAPDVCFRAVFLSTDVPLPAAVELADYGIVVLHMQESSPILREPTATYSDQAASDSLRADRQLVASNETLNERLEIRELLTPNALREFLDRLVEALYPTPPVDLTGEPLDDSQVRLLWEGLTTTPVLRPTVRDALRRATQLGLDAGSAGAPSVVNEITSRVQATGSDGASLRELWVSLLREQGLPPYLTTLYVLTVALRGDVPLDLVLMPDVRLPLLKGRVYASEFLDSHLLAGLTWLEGLESDISGLRLAMPPTWIRVRAYLHLLLEGAEPLEGEIPELMRERRERIDNIRPEIEALIGEMERPSSQPLQLLAAMDQVCSLLGADTPEEFLRSVHASSASITEMADTVWSVQELEPLALAGPAIREAWAYLQDAVPSNTDSELSLDRRVILNRASLDTLWAAPALWPGVEEAFASFRSRYAHQYSQAHDQRNVLFESLHRKLENSAPLTVILQRLNAITSLGEPLEIDIIDQHARFLHETVPCVQDNLESILRMSARCPSCNMTLEAGIPTEEIETLLYRLDRAIGEQQRRLGSQAVRQVLMRGNFDQLDRFLQAVQASDVASLTALLDDPLAAFIERLLEGNLARVPSQSIFERLQERFPSVGLAEVNVVAAEFARLLRSEFEIEGEADSADSSRINLR